jgi:hypothetical protein
VRVGQANVRQLQFHQDQRPVDPACVDLPGLQELHGAADERVEEAVPGLDRPRAFTALVEQRYGR